MELESLRELYIDELKDLYSAEKQLVKALPRMAKNATNPELKSAFTEHLAQTEQHVERLEQIFELLETSPRGKKCVGMEGLIEEAKELLEEDAEEEVVDAGLISKAQHVEHYEMAGYGTVRTWAQLLGESEHVELLEQTLNEEKETDALLTQLAESSVNVEAASSEEDSTEREVTRAVAKEGASSSGRRSPASKSRSQSSTRASAR
jgi:ferritin-like metal-binding protein YciE